MTTKGATAAGPGQDGYHEAEYIDITVTDPTKINEGTGEFTRYKITTEVSPLYCLKKKSLLFSMNYLF